MYGLPLRVTSAERSFFLVITGKILVPDEGNLALRGCQGREQVPLKVVLFRCTDWSLTQEASNETAVNLGVREPGCNTATGVVEVDRVDSATGKASLIDLNGANVLNGDGLLLEGDDLYVVQNANNQISVVDLNGGSPLDTSNELSWTRCSTSQRRSSISVRGSTSSTHD